MSLILRPEISSAPKSNRDAVVVVARLAREPRHFGLLTGLDIPMADVDSVDKIGMRTRSCLRDAEEKVRTLSHFPGTKVPQEEIKSVLALVDRIPLLHELALGLGAAPHDKRTRDALLAIDQSTVALRDALYFGEDSDGFLAERNLRRDLVRLRFRLSELLDTKEDEVAEIRKFAATFGSSSDKPRQQLLVEAIRSNAASLAMICSSCTLASPDDLRSYVTPMHAEFLQLASNLQELRDLSGRGDLAREVCQLEETSEIVIVGLELIGATSRFSSSIARVVREGAGSSLKLLTVASQRLESKGPSRHLATR